VRFREPPRNRVPPAVPAQAAFVAALEHNQTALYTFARNLIGDAEEAHDIVQEVFADAWRAALRQQPPFTAQSSETDIRRWLFHVTYQRAISLRRHRSILAWESLDFADPPEPSQSVPSLPFDQRLVEGDALREALARLNVDEVACIVLKVLQGFTLAEIARILDLSPAAARQRFSRAMRRLRTIYLAREIQQCQAGVLPESPEGRIRS
jgi:RNA polymerase sigma-70 factor (ECF subfamily)